MRADGERVASASPSLLGWGRKEQAMASERLWKCCRNQRPVAGAWRTLAPSEAADGPQVRAATGSREGPRPGRCRHFSANTKDEGAGAEALRPGRAGSGEPARLRRLGTLASPARMFSLPKVPSKRQKNLARRYCPLGGASVPRSQS